MQALLQAIELGGVVHFQLLDAHPRHFAECAGFLRVTHRGCNVPAIFVKALHQAKAKPAGGADDEGSSWSGHRSIPVAVEEKDLSILQPGVMRRINTGQEMSNGVWLCAPGCFACWLTGYPQAIPQLMCANYQAAVVLYA
ncbi:hypothetical protein D3C79_690360 [compost metagenome]